MLQITSITPQNSQTNVFIDELIEVTFNKEVASSSLIVTNFVLYVMPGYSAQVPLTISKQDNIVKLAPHYDFDPNQEYQLLIVGDNDISDTIPFGLVAADGDTMDGNHISNFTTGTKKKTDIDIDIDIDDGSLDPDTTDEYIDVIGTSPANYDTFVSGMDVIGIEFDTTPIAPSINIISITGEALVFGAPVNVPIVSDCMVYDNKVECITDNNYSINTEYTVVVEEDHVSGGIGYAAEMQDSYIFRFISPIFPYYATPRNIRMKAPHIASERISDYLLWQMILDASIEASFLLQIPYLQPDQVSRLLHQLVVCLVLYALARGIVYGTIRGIKMKALADLRIEYDQKQLKDAIDDFKECIDDILIQLGLPQNAIRGIKSGINTYYPGRRRTIHSPEWNTQEWLKGQTIGKDEIW